MFFRNSLIGAIALHGALSLADIAPVAPVQIGPRSASGVRDHHRDPSKWTGEDIREFNARNGVASSRRRIALQAVRS